MPLPRLSAVYPSDTPVAELAGAEMFTVTSARLWAAHCCDAASTAPDWRDGFAAARIGEDGVTAFDTLFRIVASTARRSLDIRCWKCPRLGADEGWLLQSTSLLQRDKIAAARLIFMDWLPPSSARTAMLPAVAFAYALTGKGLIISQRHSEAAQTQALAARGLTDRGLTLVQ